LAKKLSVDIKNDFSTDKKFSAGYTAYDFRQSGLNVQFSIFNVQFSSMLWKAHYENAAAQLL
jgi:hypothetical protein